MTVAKVTLWGKTVGAVAESSTNPAFAAFEFDPDFELDPAPFVMPRRTGRVYEFLDLPQRSFHGLPGMLADSLPDKFGNRVINRWLQTQNRGPLTAIERLCYTGARGMGALEFEPAVGPAQTQATALDVDALRRLASSVLDEREELSADLEDPKAMAQIVQVGTSAGGARAKAVVAWNRETGEMRSGQLEHGDAFEHWLIKFDGVDGNSDKEDADPQGYGLVEYAYHLMAREAGIEMADCELLRRSGHSHFLTKRFDSLGGGRKLHMQSLAALQHLDFNDAGAEGYELAMYTITDLGLGAPAHEQQLARAIFNVLARNQDDHVKNIAFLMSPDGRWSLSPAYDVTHAFNPDGAWTGRHQMSINGKLDSFVRDDFIALGEAGNLKRRRVLAIYDQVRAAVSRWPDFASAAGVPEEWAAHIATTHRVLDA